MSKFEPNAAEIKKFASSISPTAKVTWVKRGETVFMTVKVEELEKQNVGYLTAQKIASQVLSKFYGNAWGFTSWGLLSATAKLQS